MGQLPASSRRSHPRREARHVRDLDVAGGEVTEALVREVVVADRREDLARNRTPDPETGETRRDVTDEGVLIFLVPPDPCEVSAPGGGPGHETEPVVGEPRDGEIRFDPASTVQHLRVHDAADAHVTSFRAQPLQQARAPPRPDFAKSSRRQRGSFSDGNGLGTIAFDHCSPAPPLGRRLLHVVLVRPEPFALHRLLAELARSSQRPYVGHPMAARLFSSPVPERMLRVDLSLRQRTPLRYGRPSVDTIFERSIEGSPRRSLVGPPTDAPRRRSRRAREARRHLEPAHVGLAEDEVVVG